MHDLCSSMLIELVAIWSSVRRDDYKTRIGLIQQPNGSSTEAAFLCRSAHPRAWREWSWCWDSCTRITSLLSRMIGWRSTGPLAMQLHCELQHHEASSSGVPKHHHRHHHHHHLHRHYLWSRYQAVRVAVRVFLSLRWRLVSRMAESEADTPSTPIEFESKYFEFDGVRLPPFCRGKMEEIANFSLRSSDIWIVTYPKSGKRASASPSAQRWLCLRTLLAGLLLSAAAATAGLPLWLLKFHHIHKVQGEQIYILRQPQGSFRIAQPLNTHAFCRSGRALGGSQLSDWLTALFIWRLCRRAPFMGSLISHYNQQRCQHGWSGAHKWSQVK